MVTHFVPADRRQSFDAKALPATLLDDFGILILQARFCCSPWAM